MTFVGALLVRIRDGFRDTKGFGVERGLWDKAVGEGNAEKTSNSGCAAEKKDVPVKASRLAEWKFSALCDKG